MCIILPIRRRALNAKQKKPFRAPKLKIYGDVARITEAVGMSGAMDGAMGTNNKTAP